MELVDMNLRLTTDTNGVVTIATETPIGLLPLLYFSSLRETRKFAMGILGYCEYFDPEVPDVFIRAFEKEGENGTDRGTS
jgi:hypothetical protein